TAPTPPAAPPAGSGAVTVAAPGSPAASWANAPPPAGTAPAVHPLWQQAQQAEQQGNRAEAIRLYEELGRSVANTDYNLATKAYNQAGYLRSLGQAAAAPGAAPARVHPIPPANDRLQPVPSVLQASAAPSCVPCQTTSSSLGGLYRSHPGRLRPSSRSLEGPTYALEDSQGCLLMYVTPQPGLNLEPYLYHIVEIVGPLYYRGDLRTYHMRAVQVVSVR
ncbi:MAG TPA: hypothetical protein VNK04_15205, partial [Gemmataceae bacterium]|nr:hypothetical protein [Gemmataceae bacterium]